MPFSRQDAKDAKNNPNVFFAVFAALARRDPARSVLSTGSDLRRIK
jgi:hypothetical protein